MTFKEKLAQEHPKLVDDKYTGGCKGCPESYDYEEGSGCEGACSDEKCTKCWNREMPDTPAQMTAEEAWELVNKIYDFPCDKHEAIFGEQHSFYEVISELTIHEVKAKIDEWESKHIQVGDVVSGAFVQEAIVLKIMEETMYLLFSDGSSGKHKKKDYKKTGKHIDIQSVLDQIGGDGNEE